MRTQPQPSQQLPQQQQPQQPQQQYGLMPMLRPRPLQTQPQQLQPQITKEQPAQKKMKWGKPTWTLFHILAERVSDEAFAVIRPELLRTIHNICSNLPCPNCTSHATQYLSGINLNSIQTKEQLKNMLFVFHNTVNARKGYPIFTQQQLDESYKTENILLVINEFLFFFRDKSKSIRMIAEDMYRERMAVQLDGWFRKNLSAFVKS